MLLIVGKLLYVERKLYLCKPICEKVCQIFRKAGGIPR